MSGNILAFIISLGILFCIFIVAIPIALIYLWIERLLKR